MCSGRQCRSTDMQHDLFGSGHDLDLRSNFQHDLSRSNYISFDAVWQEKHDAGKRNIVSLLSQKVLQKNVCRKKCYFWSFCSLAGGQTVDLRSNLSALKRKNVKRAIECVFAQHCSSSSSRVMRQLVQKCWNRPNLTFGDLWWPDLKID